MAFHFHGPTWWMESIPGMNPLMELLQTGHNVAPGFSTRSVGRTQTRLVGSSRKMCCGPFVHGHRFTECQCKDSPDMILDLYV